MTKLKYIFEQTILIAFGIVLAMAMEGVGYHFAGEEISFTWMHLVSIIVVAFLCSIPGLLFVDMDKMSRGKFITRLITHCILVYVIVMGLGYAFAWYTKWFGLLLVSIAYLLVYGFVWVGIVWIGKKDAVEINSALDAIRDEE